MPRLSVVIASCVGAPFLPRCLKSLESQRRGGEIEFVVADRAGGEVASAIERDFPWVQLIRRPAVESVPDLRRHAIAASRAPWIAIIEEHCVAAPDWIETILRCTALKVGAIGGPIADDGYARLMDWAVYLTEYNAYLPPYERGPSYNICGANCVYRRDLLDQFLPGCGNGYWEAELNNKLLAGGHSFLNEPDLVVRHTGPFHFFYYLHQRFLFSRAFAGIRRAHVPMVKRLAYVILAPLIVPLLILRTGQRIRAKGRYFGKFLAALPILVPVNIVYVCGEWIGYLFGPGDSLSKIE